MWRSSNNPYAVLTMSKRPTDHLEPSAKKRGNERQLTKDDEEDDEEQVRRPPLWALPACWHTGRVLSALHRQEEPGPSQPGGGRCLPATTRQAAPGAVADLSFAAR